MPALPKKKKLKSRVIKSKQSNENSLGFELEGTVFIVERDSKGNIVSETALEPKLVLSCLVKALESSVALQAVKDSE